MAANARHMRRRAHDAREMEPLGCGEWATEKSEGWSAGCGPVRRRHRDVPSANPGACERIRSTWMCGGRIRGVAFLLVTSLWPNKGKLPAPPGGEAEKDMMSVFVKMDPGFRRDDEQR